MKRLIVAIFLALTALAVPPPPLGGLLPIYEEVGYYTCPQGLVGVRFRLYEVEGLPKAATPGNVATYELQLDGKEEFYYNPVIIFTIDENDEPLYFWFDFNHDGKIDQETPVTGKDMPATACEVFFR